MFVKLAEPIAFSFVSPDDPPATLARQVASMHPAASAPSGQGGAID